MSNRDYVGSMNTDKLICWQPCLDHFHGLTDNVSLFTDVNSCIFAEGFHIPDVFHSYPFEFVIRFGEEVFSGSRQKPGGWQFRR